MAKFANIRHFVFVVFVAIVEGYGKNRENDLNRCFNDSTVHGENGCISSNIGTIICINAATVEIVEKMDAFPVATLATFSTQTGSSKVSRFFFYSARSRLLLGT